MVIEIFVTIGYSVCALPQQFQQAMLSVPIVSMILEAFRKTLCISIATVKLSNQSNSTVATDVSTAEIGNDITIV
jgi:hypothetical protein